MLLKKQKFTKKLYVGQFIKYKLFDIYDIRNASKSKIIKIKNITFDENSHYDFINIILN